jgi:hypothetical protein
LFVLLVTADPRTTSGFVTFQVRVVVQVFASAGILQGLELAESVPDIVGAVTVTVVHDGLQLLFSFDSATTPRDAELALSAHARI